MEKEPLQIVKERNNHSRNKEYFLDVEALSSILDRKSDNKSFPDLPVMLISIAGDYRKGKRKFDKDL